MVDCRLCKKHYTIFGSEADEEKNQIICLAKKLFVDWEFVTSGACEEYDDVDGYDPRE